MDDYIDVEKAVDSDPELCRLRREHDALAAKLETMVGPEALAVEMENTATQIAHEIDRLHERLDRDPRPKLWP